MDQSKTWMRIQSSSDLFYLHPWADQAPVNIIKLCKALSITLKLEPMDHELLAMVHIRDGHPIIGANMLLPKYGLRMVVARNIAHCILHAEEVRAAVAFTIHRNGCSVPDEKADLNLAKMHMDATRFARELLLPETALEMALAKHALSVQLVNLDFPDVREDKALVKVAATMKVPLQTLLARIAELQGANQASAAIMAPPQTAKE